MEEHGTELNTNSEDLTTEKLSSKPDELRDIEASAEVQFSPPLYQQRYNLAIHYLTQHNVKSVVDFGCAECSFFKLLPTIPSLQKVSLVDLDHTLLVSKKWKIEPELRHFIFRRPNPLHVQLYSGSAANFDQRIAGCEAITLIEVIEHLHSDILHQVTENVFKNLHPKLCVITTPNSEFNPLFQNDNSSAFRHWDHKFEWTRDEFRTWCDCICSQYAYQVEYTGVGYLTSKPESHHLGPCSQAAIFTHTDEDAEECIRSNASDEILDPNEFCYELIAESYFPYETCEMTKEETIDIEISLYLRQIAVLRKQGLVSTRDRNECSEDEEDEDKFIISIDQIASLRSIKDLCDKNEVRERLQLKGYEISADGQRVNAHVSDLLENNDDDFEEDEEQVDWRGDPCNEDDDEVSVGTASQGLKQDCGNDGAFFSGIQWESDWDLSDRVTDDKS